MVTIVRLAAILFGPDAGRRSRHANPDAAVAQSRPAFAGRLRCVDAATTLRQGTFTLPVGRVRLTEGRACVKPDATYNGCEWSVTLLRSDKWGEKGQFLVVTLEAEPS